MDLLGGVISIIKIVPYYISKLFFKKNYFKLTPLRQAEALEWLFNERLSEQPVIRHCQHLKLRGYGFADDIIVSRKVILHYINNKFDYKYCNSIFSMRGAYEINNGQIIPKKEKKGTLAILFLVWLMSGLSFALSLTHGIYFDFSFEIKAVMIGSLIVFVFYAAIFYVYLSSHSKIMYILPHINKADKPVSLLSKKTLRASILRRD
ncbi:hypothetical protein G5574_15540 [Pantoea stewartii]|uniref:hypothetical protein n=1 Tax=Pantoea stewartii TaxID=66269 RepID=UPI0013DE1F71|nr:hypothetical protein [Pantoea stewartii]QIE98264.1 hypothetical protein G5574_15540 [Pantoea stewartii]